MSARGWHPPKWRESSHFILNFILRRNLKIRARALHEFKELWPFFFVVVFLKCSCGGIIFQFRPSKCGHCIWFKDPTSWNDVKKPTDTLIFPVKHKWKREAEYLKKAEGDTTASCNNLCSVLHGYCKLIFFDCNKYWILFVIKREVWLW